MVEKGSEARDVRVRATKGHIGRFSGTIPDTLEGLHGFPPAEKLRSKEEILKYKEQLITATRQTAALLNSLKEDAKAGKIPEDEAEFAQFNSMERLRERGVPDAHIEIAQKILGAYHERRTLIQSWVQENQNDPVRMYKSLSGGQEPTGRVSFRDHGLAVELMCFIPSDMEALGEFGSEKAAAFIRNLPVRVGDKETEVVRGCIALNLRATQTNERRYLNPIAQNVGPLRDHELEHGWFQFIRESLVDETVLAAHTKEVRDETNRALKSRPFSLMERFGPFPPDRSDPRFKEVERYVGEVFGAYMRSSFASEILSHSHNDVPPWNGKAVDQSIAQRYADYIRHFANNYFRATASVNQTDSKTTAKWLKHAEERVQSSVVRDARRALSSIRVMMNAGLTKEEVVTIFTLEPLQRWPKIALRFNSVLKPKTQATSS